MKTPDYPANKLEALFDLLSTGAVYDKKTGKLLYVKIHGLDDLTKAIEAYTASQTKLTLEKLLEAHAVIVGGEKFYGDVPVTVIEGMIGELK